MTFAIPGACDTVLDGKPEFFLSAALGVLRLRPCTREGLEVALPATRGFGVLFGSRADKVKQLAVKFFSFN